MNYASQFDLNLTGETFNALKNDFNKILRNTLSQMESKSSEAAEMSIKLKISLKKDFAQFGEMEPREVLKPQFDHKVASQITLKNELSGSLGGNYELVWDEESGEYVMREIVDGQTSIFDAEYAVVDEEPASKNEAQLLLPENASSDESLENCRQVFRDCICHECTNNDGICCTTHGRDCNDTTECEDWDVPIEEDEIEVYTVTSFNPNVEDE